MTTSGSVRLGAQMWLERDSTPDRIDQLVAAAAASGLGLLRIFLIWPWIEPEPGVWDFALYDAAFTAAQRHGLRIKATLTPDTAPWHEGAPGLVQSGHIALPSTEHQRPAIRRYLHACVRRYAKHPALAQWILWNEPFNAVTPPGQPNHRRSDELLRRWADLLQARYLGDLRSLNLRWHTGYKSFEEIPFPEDITHAAHRSGPFFSFDPWLAEYELRAAALCDELAWVSKTIRELDPTTQICVNPPDLYRNHAELGYDFTALAAVTDVLGASIHAPWHLGFSPRPGHVGLLACAVRMLRETPGQHGVELTEVQTGNVHYGSPHPVAMSAADTAASFLAPVLAGASTVTGWALNTRSSDFEAGDWALLDDDDRPGDRSAAARHVAEVLTVLERRLGRWQPRPAEALVLFSERSQAVTLIHSWTSTSLPGRAPDDAIQGAGLLALELLQSGITAALAPVEALGHRAPPKLLVASHLSAIDEVTGRALLEHATRGAVLVLDATTGHKDLRAGVYRPWPAFLATELGFRVRGLHTQRHGHPVELFGAPVGRLPLVCADYEFDDPAWQPDIHLRLPGQGGYPLVWRRDHGAGAVVLVGAPLGPGLVADPAARAVARRVWDVAMDGTRPQASPVSADTVALLVDGELADAVAFFAPSLSERAGQPLCVALPPGGYDDLWSNRHVECGPEGVMTLQAPEGIAVLVAEPGVLRVTRLAPAAPPAHTV